MKIRMNSDVLVVLRPQKREFASWLKGRSIYMNVLVQIEPEKIGRTLWYSTYSCLLLYISML